MERTLIIVKPDGVERRLVGEIIGRFERKGFRIVGLKMIRIPKDKAEENYAVHKGKPFYNGLINFMTSGPVVLMVLEGNSAVAVARTMMGATFGYQAQAGTIRGDYGLTQTYNIVHGSDSPENALREISVFFNESELVDYEMPDQGWLMDKP